MEKKTNILNKKIHLVGSVSGWLMIIIGIIVWFAGVTMEPESAIQQIVQWLGYVTAIMLICTGVVCNYLGKILFAIKDHYSEEEFKLDIKQEDKGK